ncbi:MAG TPA: hypothetical protein VKP65_02260 [Rhodothermales bacterium]|nr:hypothetical protein [Rhodothermales bacterium]
MEQKRKMRAAGPIRITLPAKVAYSPDALKESIASVMERIGCPKCFSGADCFFQMERSFVLDASLNADPSPQPSRAVTGFAARQSHEYTVGLSQGVKHDINRVYRAVDKVIDIIGAHPCISGFDILFKDVLQTIVIPENLEAQAFDQRF